MPGECGGGGEGVGPGISLFLRWPGRLGGVGGGVVCLWVPCRCQGSIVEAGPGRQVCGGGGARGDEFVCEVARRVWSWVYLAGVETYSGCSSG